jgi:DNA-binding response OmpR family regulator
MNIIVVSDNERLSQKYIQVLADRGHLVIPCTRKAHALAYARRLKPDVVIVRGNAADATGPQMVLALTMLNQPPQRIIAICMSHLPGHRQDLLSFGADQVLDDDHDLLDLLKAIGIPPK